MFFQLAKLTPNTEAAVSSCQSVVSTFTTDTFLFLGCWNVSLCWGHHVHFVLAFSRSKGSHVLTDRAAVRPADLGLLRADSAELAGE